MPSLSIVTVVGNPKARSRTSGAATTLAASVAAHLTSAGATTDSVVHELPDLGAGLLGWGDEAVAAVVDSVRRADVLVVACPNYKGTYTGLLKLFLDQLPSNGLAGVVAVPLMVGAAAHQALAVEVHLRPVLVELGASVPTRGLYVLEGELADLDAVLAAWWQDAAVPLTRALGLPT